jgi:hypothetical protein
VKRGCAAVGIQRGEGVRAGGSAKVRSAALKPNRMRQRSVHVSPSVENAAFLIVFIEFKLV